MKHFSAFFLCAFLMFVFVVDTATAKKVNVTSLKVEMKDNPLGLSLLKPRFMWQISSSVPDLKQKSYRIQVSARESDLRKGVNLIWDSGVKQSDESLFVPYGGPSLASRTLYFWRIKVSTNQGESDWSEINHWSMALLNDSDWKGVWIGENALSNAGETDKGKTRLAARYLRKPFTTQQKVKRAVLYISGLGLYEASLNNKRVSEDVFAPTPSWYPERVYYNVVDVTSLVRKGSNVLGVKLGNGRFFGMREGDTQVFGLPRLLAQLEIEYVDGTTEVVASDHSWKVTSKGPIIANNEFDGEEYDAGKELKGWCGEDFDDSAWKAADLMDAPSGKLTAQPNPNLYIQEEIKPVKILARADGKFIVDMGQNMVGRLNVKLKGKKGHPVTMRFAEVVKKGDSLYLDNIRTANVTDIYTPASDGTFSWEPSFTYHGFRFVEISGLDYSPSLKDFTGKVIYDKMETTGSFETSNEMINQIYKNAFWGIRGNYRGMPTDCPQRDERQGWLGDRATGCFGEAFALDNGNLYSKWAQDIEDSQSPEGSISAVSPRYWTIYNEDVTWPAAYFYAIDMLYRQYGDVNPIKKHYASMKRYMEHIEKVSMQDYILTKDTYGDWCMPPETQQLIHSQDPARKTDGAILSTTMYFSLLNLMMEFAQQTGNSNDIPRYKELAAKIRTAYNNRFFDSAKAQYGNGTVTANILSLRLGLVPEGYEQKVFDNIVKKTEIDFDGHVSTGVLGIQQLMRGLTQYGRADIAYKIATNDTYPSWGYMVKNGATTIWELWNGNTADPAMNSGNHVMLLGDLLIWYYEDLAGIKNAPESVGFKQLLMAPVFPNGLNHVKASYRSVYGEIKSEWSKVEGVFTWNITIPGNTSAIVRLPSALNIRVIQKEGLRHILQEDAQTEIELGSGTYQLVGETK